MASLWFRCPPPPPHQKNKHITNSTVKKAPARPTNLEKTNRFQSAVLFYVYVCLPVFWLAPVGSLGQKKGFSLDLSLLAFGRPTPGLRQRLLVEERQRCHLRVVENCFLGGQSSHSGGGPIKYLSLPTLPRKMPFLVLPL